MQNPMIGRVTSHYDLNRKHPVYGTVQPHRGIDLGAPVGIKPWDYIGAPVKAVYGGTVERTYTNWRDGQPGWSAIWGRSGNGVLIRNPDGEAQWYGHLHTVNVKPGQRVTEGQIIGGMGVSGNVTGPHLHLEFHYRTSNDGNKWQRTRNPMLDFRAAGIVPGVDPIILHGANKTANETTTTTEPAPEGLTVSQYEDLKKGQDDLARKLDRLQNSVGGANISITASNGKTYKTNVNGALKVIEILVRDNAGDIDQILERVGELAPQDEQEKEAADA